MGMSLSLLLFLGCGSGKTGSGYQGDGSYFQSSTGPHSDSYSVNRSRTGRAMFDSSACNPRQGAAFEGERNAKTEKSECKECKACKACKEKCKAKCEHHKDHGKTDKGGQAFMGDACEAERSFFGELSPAAAPRPIGMARVDVKTGIVSMAYRIDVGNVENINGAYLHLGATDGKLGPIVATLYKGEPRSGSFRESLTAGTLTPDRLTGPMQGKDLTLLADEVRYGNVFVRVTTTERPEGVLIGRLGMNQPATDTRDRFMGENPTPANKATPSYKPDTKQPSDLNPPADKQPIDKQPTDMSYVPARGGVPIVLAADEPVKAADKALDKDKAFDKDMDHGKVLFQGDEHGTVFVSTLKPPTDAPDAKATLILGANKDSTELRYHMMLRDVKDPKGVNLYLVEKTEKAPAGEKAPAAVHPEGEKALDRAEKAVEKAGEKVKDAAHEAGEAIHHAVVDKLGEPIAKLTIKGEIKPGVFNGVFAEGTLTKNDLAGALKGKDMSALIDHIRQGHVYVAVITEKDATGKFQGVVEMKPAMEKGEKERGAGFKGEEKLPAKPANVD